MNTLNSKYILGFDILKFLMAVVIISLHTSVAKLFPAPINIFALNFQSLAVPIFFVISGLLFFQKISHSPNPNNDLWTYEKRLLILYLIWSIIMSPITLRYHNYLNYGFRGFAFWIKDFFFDYTFLASWFFGALLVGMPIVYSIRNRPCIICVVSVVLYVCFHFMDAMPAPIKSCFAFYEDYLGTPQRSFLQAIVWLGAGCLLCRTNVRKICNRLNDNLLFALMGGGDTIQSTSIHRSHSYRIIVLQKFQYFSKCLLIKNVTAEQYNNILYTLSNNTFGMAFYTRRTNNVCFHDSTYFKCDNCPRHSQNVSI